MADKGIIFSAPMVRALLEGRKSQTRRLLTLNGYRGLSQFGRSDTPGYDWHFRRADTCWCDISEAQLRELLPYAPGDRLYVREAYTVRGVYSDVVEVGYRAHERASHSEFVEQWPIETAVDVKGKRPVDTWPFYKPSIHMPRWASRLWLSVTDVRVQRVQEISEEDAAAEGLYRSYPDGEDREWLRYYTQEHSGREPTEAEWADFNAGTWMVPGVRQGWGLTKAERERDQWAPTARSAFSFLWNSLHTKPGERWEDNPFVVAISFSVHHGNIDTPSTSSTRDGRAPNKARPENA